MTGGISPREWKINYLNCLDDGWWVRVFVFVSIYALYDVGLRMHIYVEQAGTSSKTQENITSRRDICWGWGDAFIQPYILSWGKYIDLDHIGVWNTGFSINAYTIRPSRVWNNTFHMPHTWSRTSLLSISRASQLRAKCLPVTFRFGKYNHIIAPSRLCNVCVHALAGRDEFAIELNRSQKRSGTSSYLMSSAYVLVQHHKNVAFSTVLIYTFTTMRMIMI